MVWTLGWILVASVAGQRLFESGAGAALTNTIVTTACIAFGVLATVRFIPRNRKTSEEKSPPRALVASHHRLVGDGRVVFRIRRLESCSRRMFDPLRR